MFSFVGENRGMLTTRDLWPMMEGIVISTLFYRSKVNYEALTLQQHRNEVSKINILLI